MATISVATDGALAVGLSPQEQTFLMLAKEEGQIEQKLTEVFTLWLNNYIRDTFQTRFGRLDPADQAEFLLKVIDAKPRKG